MRKTIYWPNLLVATFKLWVRSHFKRVSLFFEKVEVALSQGSTYLIAEITESFCCHYEGRAFISTTKHRLQIHTFIVHKPVLEKLIGNYFVHNQVQTDANIQSNVRSRKRTRVDQEDRRLFNDDNQPLETRVSAISDKALEMAEQSLAYSFQNHSSAEVDQTFWCLAKTFFEKAFIVASWNVTDFWKSCQRT